MFSQQCPSCGHLARGNFCTEATCRRKFLILPDQSDRFCPLHTPVPKKKKSSTGQQAWLLKMALRCPECGHNFFDVKSEDPGAAG